MALTRRPFFSNALEERGRFVPALCVLLRIDKVEPGLSRAPGSFSRGLIGSQRSRDQASKNRRKKYKSRESQFHDVHPFRREI